MKPSHLLCTWRAALTVVVIVRACLGGDLRAQTYLVTDLGTLGGEASRALSINNAGLVVGRATTPGGQTHAVLLSTNVLVDLGTLGGTNSAATDISEASHVTGWSNFAETGAQRAFLYTAGTMIDIGRLLSDSTNSIGHGVNSLGTVVGDYQTADGRLHPFVYANGILPLGFEGSARCINDLGQIGGFEINNGKLGFIISGAQRQHVGSLGSNDTEIVRLNTNGLAVGRSLTTNGVYHACAYQDGVLHDLGTLGGSSSAAYGVNNPGHIVGQALDASGNERAFVYQRGRMTDLNTLLPGTSGWILQAAYGINDSGQIVGVGQINGKVHGFLLTPNFLDLSLYPGLTMVGRVGRKYRVEYLDAINPTNTWQALTNMVLPGSPYFFIDPRPLGFGNRLYRSVLLPD
ncbi:MAG: hypothetical protein U1G07_01330 [Verrucomicrobiota bacterium]